MAKGPQVVRHAEVYRESSYTKVYLNLGFDGGSKQDTKSGIEFLDQLLATMGFHSRLDLGVNCEHVSIPDEHHTVDDVGIALGQAIRKALGDYGTLVRSASVHGVCDDALVLVALDLGGRSHIGWEAEFRGESVSGLSSECVREFFRAVASNAGFSLHVHKLAGHNDHHLCEAIFKGFGLALRAAVELEDRPGPANSKR